MIDDDTLAHMEKFALRHGGDRNHRLTASADDVLHLVDEVRELRAALEVERTWHKAGGDGPAPRTGVHYEQITLGEWTPREGVCAECGGINLIASNLYIMGEDGPSTVGQNVVCLDCAGIAATAAEHGETREVPKMPPENHTHVNPLAELAMHFPDTPVIVVEMPEP